MAPSRIRRRGDLDLGGDGRRQGPSVGGDAPIEHHPQTEDVGTRRRCRPGAHLGCHDGRVIGEASPPRQAHTGHGQTPPGDVDLVLAQRTMMQPEKMPLVNGSSRCLDDRSPLSPPGEPGLIGQVRQPLTTSRELICLEGPVDPFDGHRGHESLRAGGPQQSNSMIGAPTRRRSLDHLGLDRFAARGPAEHLTPAPQPHPFVGCPRRSSVTVCHVRPFRHVRASIVTRRSCHRSTRGRLLPCPSVAQPRSRNSSTFLEPW